MSMMREIRERRVIPYVSAYVVACWGLVQFVAFLEGRLLLSPHLVNLIALGLLALLPSVVLLAWCHGRPGADRWGRTEKVTLPVNVLAATVLLFVVFGDKDLGAVTETVEFQDEDGTVIERKIPKADYRRRLLAYYFENDGDPADDWLSQGLATAVVVDVNQDSWVDCESPVGRVANLRRAGHPDGLDLPRPIMRKIAREAHIPVFLTGSFARAGGGYTLSLELHETESGRIIATREIGPAGVFELVDEASTAIREDLDLPAVHLENEQDLPVADLLSTDLEAYRGFVEGTMALAHANDWTGAAAPIGRAVELDPGFALAHFMLYAALMNTGDVDGAITAMGEAMDHLYRLSERTQFMVKATYYFNVKQDPDKTKAILDMWTRLYPNDISAHGQVAAYANLRRDHVTALRAFETIFAIDPTRFEVLPMIADLHVARGDFEAAERVLERYAEAHPTDVRSFTQLADLHLEFGRLDDAREALEQALLIEPERTGTLSALTGIDMRLGRFAEAENALERLSADADNDEDRRRVLRDLVDLHTIQGRWRQARRDLDSWDEAALATIPPSQVHLAHAMKLPRVTASSAADSVLAVMTELRVRTGPPNDRVFGMCEAEILIMLGRLDEAESALGEAEGMIDEYQLEAVRYLVLHVRGKLAEARGDLAAALVHYERCVELNPTDQRFMRGLARLQRLTGDHGAAEKTVKKTLAHSPGHPEPNLEMALLQEARGRGEAGRPFLEKTLAAWAQADPDHPGLAEARALESRLGAIQ